jgi:hypothetical protein
VTHLLVADWRKTLTAAAAEPTRPTNDLYGCAARQHLDATHDTHQVQPEHFCPVAVRTSVGDIIAKISAAASVPSEGNIVGDPSKSGPVGEGHLPGATCTVPNQLGPGILNSHYLNGIIASLSDILRQ